VVVAEVLGGFVMRSTDRAFHRLVILLIVCAVAAPSAEEGGDDEARRLLAQQELLRGATAPGPDPAYLLLPRRSGRFDARTLLDERAEAMAERSVQYLIEQQASDGSWSEARLPRNTGVTGLACLALIADGNMPRVGRHGKALDRGIEFLLKNSKDNGLIVGESSNPYGPMYEHAYSTLALLLAYGNCPWHSQMREVLGRSIEIIRASQHPDGGWRYAATNTGHSDVSVTATVLWVLRAAKKSGFTLPKGMVDKGVGFIERCAMPDGHFKYRAHGLHAAPEVGGACLVALANDGGTDHELIPPARDAIAYLYRRYDAEDLRERRYFIYGSFYSSVAMQLSGDAYWVPWYQKMLTVYQELQGADGEFRSADGGLIYPTALATCVMLAPRGYLPLYER